MSFFMNSLQLLFGLLFLDVVYDGNALCVPLRPFSDYFLG